MLVLLGIGFLAGLVTSLSPCVLPVLPILLAGGASGGRRRPYAIVAGLVASFTVFTLAGAALLDALGLRQDLLRDLAIAMLFLLAATLAFPRLAHLLEQPFYALTRRHAGDAGGGLVLGLSLGLVFVPCAGPVLATVSVLAATQEVGLRVVLLTLAYALGAAVPMLAIALGGRRIAAPLRARLPVLRPVLGGVVALTALAIAFGLDQGFQTAVPGYTEEFQERVERSGPAERELARLTGGEADERRERLADFGPAPDLAGIVGWVNSPPLSLAALRGRVVVVDFWTYSCINCLRTLPYLKAWDEAYRDDGLTILGVHAPEFAFEREADNVRSAVERLGIRYPVALDNGFDTWNAYANRYWPAKYFVDRRGHVRFAHFGEGAYAESERVIRRLLAEGGGAPAEPAGVEREPLVHRGEITPESYLGWERIDRYAGSPLRPDEAAGYRFRAAPLPLHHLAYDGRWRVESERAVAGVGARLRLRFRAREVHLVLSGRGAVDVLVDGRPLRSARVAGDRLYTLARFGETREGLLELRFAPGVAAYAFTFG